MKAKLVNGKIEYYNGKFVTLSNRTISNPTDEMLTQAGYKEVEYTEKPTFDKEEEKLVETYTDGEKITVSYEKVALTDYEHNEIIQQEIEAEENKITTRNIRNVIKGDNFALNKITKVENNIVELRAKIREITNEE
jgi:hypothetical protein